MDVTGDRRTPSIRADLIAGVMYTLAFALLALGPAKRLFHALDARLYDRITITQSGEPDPAISIVAIDEASVQNIGRFPFSRDIVASLIDTLSDGGADTIVSTLVFSEPQVDAGADHLRDLDAALAQLAAVRDTTANPTGASESATGSDADVPSNSDDGPAASRSAEADAIAALKQQVAGAIDAIDYDGKLAASMADAGNVLLPVLVNQRRIAGAMAAGAQNAATVLDQHALGVRSDKVALNFASVTQPLPTLAEAAAGLGHLGLVPQPDGVIRDVPLIANVRRTTLPSLALSAALARLGLSPDDVTLSADGRRLTAGQLTLPMSEDGRVLTQFYSAAATNQFRTVSFYDVFTGLVPGASFRGQTVLIGATAPGIGDALATPAGDATPPVVLLAHAVSALTQQQTYATPVAANGIVLGVFAGLFLYVVFALPRLSAVAGTLISVGLALALLLAEAILLTGYGQWLTLVSCVLFLAGGHLVMTVRRFGITERLKVQTEADSAESNRMLALAFQNQGQLDMAFEKFRRCPLDDSLMEPLYNLALDFERKRQFSKAGAVYTRMARHDRSYRDIGARLKRNERLDETLVVGTASVSGTQLILNEDEVQKPMLGRYVVEKEIGKGAMGTVYLGRDPKINRVVAIKTIALSQEFDENEVASVRERFFREAETAGRLNHPDIVTVYDAGEEHDLAYIAMEFLKGTHLSGQAKVGALLPEVKVIELMARVADALSYAHREDVVHRDIKPANIMYDPESGDLKITDFGIARITSSSKTKTGIVLGTPSYMSPEQLAGKNVTGHSDLFSLGVTLYQLLAGQLPFRADSMATLMYKIANEPHTPLCAVRPEMPARLEAIIDRSLAKEASDRYDTGARMALDLRECMPLLTGERRAV